MGEVEGAGGLRKKDKKEGKEGREKKRNCSILSYFTWHNLLFLCN